MAEMPQLAVVGVKRDQTGMAQENRANQHDSD